MKNLFCAIFVIFAALLTASELPGSPSSCEEKWPKTVVVDGSIAKDYAYDVRYTEFYKKAFAYSVAAGLASAIYNHYFRLAADAHSAWGKHIEASRYPPKARNVATAVFALMSTLEAAKSLSNAIVIEKLSGKNTVPERNVYDKEVINGLYVFKYDKIKE